MVTEHCFIGQWSQIPAPDSRADYKGVAMGLDWLRVCHSPQEKRWFALIQWWAQLQMSKMWLSGALRGMSSSPCTSPKSLSMLVLKVSQTSLLAASALSQCAMKKQVFYWRALLRCIKRRTQSLKMRLVKFSLKIEWLQSAAISIHFAMQPCRHYASSDIHAVRSQHAPCFQWVFEYGKKCKTRLWIHVWLFQWSSLSP